MHVVGEEGVGVAAARRGAFSRRASFSEAENALSEALSRVHRAGTAILDLTVTNPTAVGLGLSSHRIVEALADPEVGRYDPAPFGLHSARSALSMQFHERGYPIPPEQIMLTSSTSEAYGYLFKLLCDPGDAVLVPVPSYPLLEVLANLEGVRLVPYSLKYDGQWYLDRSLIALAHRVGARAIVTVHPNNPTGSFIKRDELAILAECDLPILSDEVFADYGLCEDARRTPSVLELSGRLVFCMGGLSKALAAPQLKLSWTAFHGPAALVSAARERLEHIADTYLSPSLPVQLGLPRWLADAQGVQAAVRARCLRNLSVLRAACSAETGSSVLAVEGGWMAIVRLPRIQEEDSWALELLHRHGVLIQPGYFYDLPGCHGVLSLITPEAVFASGVARLSAAVDDALSSGA